MNAASPNLLTLLRWATQLAAGQRCAEWETWCAASPDAAGKWERITQARELLEGGVAVAEEDAIAAELLAAYIEGRLDQTAAERIEERLWESPELLAEALSSVRFAEEPPETEATLALEQRLAAIGPPRMNGHEQATPVLYRLAPAVAKIVPPKDRPMTAIVVADTARAAAPFPLDLVRWKWLAAVAALVVVAILSGSIGWIAFGRRDAGAERPIANSPKFDEPAPPQERDESSPVIPEDKPIQKPPQSPPEPNDVPPAKQTEPTLPKPEDQQPAALPIRQPSPPLRVPKPSPPRAVLPPPPELAFHSAQGILLMETSSRGKWQVAKNPHVLQGPVKFVSLAESWTAAEVPGVATLVCEGSTELVLSRLIDGVLEIRLDRGRVGIRGLADGAQVRVLVGDAAWTARSLEPQAVLAVFHDPLSPGIAVPQGSIALDDVQIDTRQLLRWQNGTLAPFELMTSASAADGAPPPQAPPAVNPWDLDWLTPPDEARQKQWQMVHGRLIERLAEANDFEAELTRMLATSRDNRHTALLARWSAASVPPATRARRMWNMLCERRPAVRVAGVLTLLELPPGDLRRDELLVLVAQATNPATSGQVAQWLDATRQPVALPSTQAAELASHLTHEELAVRQIAVSILELHTSQAIVQAGRLPPAYDAAGPANRRAAAQQEWRVILRQLYTAANNANRALGPAALKPVP